MTGGSGKTSIRHLKTLLLRLNTKSIVYGLATTAAFVLAFFLIDLPHGAEHWSADLRTAWLSPRLASQHPNIALIYINNRTLEGYPYTLPIDRQLIADLVDRIDAAGPTVIGIDIIFDRPTEAKKDENLLGSIKRAKAQIVLGALDARSSLSERERKFHEDFLQKTGRRLGHLYFHDVHDTFVISDEVVRLIPQPVPGFTTHKSFAEELAAAATGTYPIIKSRYISWLLSPRDETETFLSLSADQVLGRGSVQVQLPLESLLKGKIVIIGGDFPDRDKHLTPLSVTDGERFAGVSIHAQILAQCLSGRSVVELSWAANLLVYAAALAFGLWAGRRDRSGNWHPLLELLAVIGLIAFDFATFWLFNLIFPMIMTLLFLSAGYTYGHYSKHILEETRTPH